MRLVGILNWYDEKPSDLAACVASLAKAGIEHLIAVDGAYALYPNGSAASPVEQHETILAFCRGAGIGCTLHIPPDVYPGNEIEKRTLGFQLAEHVTEEDDWYFLMDADQVIISALGLREALERTDLHVAEVRFHEKGYDPLSGYPVRCIFRALRGLHLFESHCAYRTVDGRFLWQGNISTGREPPQEAALDASFVLVEHTREGRTPERQNGKNLYYDRRARLGAETINA